MEGVEQIEITLVGKTRPYGVRLYFAEPGSSAIGERIFDVSIQGVKVIDGLDVAREAGGPLRSMVREIRDIAVEGTLRVEFKAIKGRSLLSGIEVFEQGE